MEEKTNTGLKISVSHMNEVTEGRCASLDMTTGWSSVLVWFPGKQTRDKELTSRSFFERHTESNDREGR